MWPWNLMDDPPKKIGHLFYTTSSFVHHFKTIDEIKLELQTGVTLDSCQNRRFFVSRDLEIWWMTLQNNRTPHLYYVKPCASFENHRLIQIGVTVRKRSIPVKIGDFFAPCDLEIRRMTLKNNRPPLLYYIKLHASFRSHRCVKTWVTVRKRSIRVKKRRLFCPVWPWNLTDDLEKQWGTSSMLFQIWCVIS